MAIFNLFNSKKKEEEKKVGSKAAKAAEKESSVKAAVKVAPAKAPAGLMVQSEPAAKKATVKSTSKSTEKTTSAKTVTAKASSVKTTAKTGVTKAPDKKATPAKAPAKKTAAKPEAKTSPKAVPAIKKESAAKTDSPKPIYYTTARPFQQATEEDVRLAFEHAIGEAEKEILKNGLKAVGKYEFSLEVDGYHFYLIANNGQILFESPSFTSMLGALNGLNTFKRTVATEEFDIKVDKYNRYRFILANKYYGENYTTREQCQKCAESVRNFANNAHIIYFTPSKEELKAFELARVTKKSADDIDWNAIAKAEANAPKKGKFEICREQNEFCFYLLASNGQILYSSRFYASESACRKGIESFKRAAYVGNFFVDRDKFGHYRYVLKNIGSAPAFIGESYDNKPQCENIIQSVKNFIVTASIEMDSSNG